MVLGELDPEPVQCLVHAGGQLRRKCRGDAPEKRREGLDVVRVSLGEERVDESPPERGALSEDHPSGLGQLERGAASVDGIRAADDETLDLRLAQQPTGRRVFEESEFDGIPENDDVPTAAGKMAE